MSACARRSSASTSPEHVPCAQRLSLRVRSDRLAHLREEDARAWFEQHAPALMARKRRSAVSGSTTVAIDLGLRMTEAQALGDSQA